MRIPCVKQILLSFFCYIFRQSKNSFSVAVSKALVASSNKIKEGSLYNSLAIPILCICPPDNETPLSPTLVSSLFGRDKTNSNS